MIRYALALGLGYALGRLVRPTSTDRPTPPDDPYDDVLDVDDDRPVRWPSHGYVPALPTEAAS